MPHVDEGTLHALLDGALRAMEPREADAVEAHLEACVDCRARLEEAAALRGRAGEVLAVLEPAVAPDFDEVLVRAGAADRGRPLARQARWTRGLAWAATIVIALGTGYLIRDRLVLERAVSARSVELPTAGGAEGAAGGAGDDGTDDAGTAADGGAAGAEAAELQDARGPELERSGVAAGAREGARPAAAAGAAAPPVARPSTPVSPPATGSEDLTETAEAAAAAEPPAEPPLEPRIEPVAGLRAGEQARVVEEVRVTALEAAERAITPEEAGDLLGTPLLILPGAELVRAAAAGAGDVPAVVSVQQLGEGTLVRVTQRSLGAEAPLGRAVAERTREAAAPAGVAEDSRAPSRLAQPRLEAAMRPADAAGVTALNTVTVEVSGSALVLEGALSTAALELLGASATPYVAPR